MIYPGSTSNNDHVVGKINPIVIHLYLHTYIYKFLVTFDTLTALFVNKKQKVLTSKRTKDH